MGITIKELSKISGYSCSTISRVITNKGNVNKETKEAIEKLLIEYNYRNNIIELRKSKLNKQTIMIIVGDLNNWYYTELIREVKSVLWEKDYIPVIGFSDNQINDEREYVQMAFQENYSGIIFINVRGGGDLAPVLEQNNTPIVFLNRGIKFGSFDTVCSDNYQGGYIATDYLIRMGHKKIGHLTGSLYSTTALERKRGYEDAMRDNKLVVTTNSIYFGDLNSESGYKYGEELVKKALDYTAVFCGNDLMTLGLLEALDHYGVKVPDDISVVCYDDTPIARRARPSLTTVGTDATKLGKKAVELLVSRIEGDAGEASSIFYKPKLIIRDSVKKII
jgi:DNA-binding LacI/PurR family transcriptional regulator